MKSISKNAISEKALCELRARFSLREPVYVTRPTMPSLDAYHALLETVWKTRWLTNNGQLHQEFERRVAEHLGVEHVSLFCNGTIALIVALQALGITEGEVITTPFTFPATAHVLHWNRLCPVFCDIDACHFNLDPGRIEGLIGPNTRAILPVHVFGNPCDTEAIGEIAERHGLHVIYDAAHAFSVRVNGRSVSEAGDMSVLSFHATKQFSSVEGGAIVSRSSAAKQRVDFLKNFGFADEETVIGPGINGKMNEFQAAFGLLQLDMVSQEILNRKRLTEIYRTCLADTPGISFQTDVAGVEHNYAYFTVLVDEERFGVSRDELYILLKGFNIFSRKYFHPLCSHLPCYTSLPSADAGNLAVAERIARQILCLPLYGTLEEAEVRTISSAIRSLQQEICTG